MLLPEPPMGIEPMTSFLPRMRSTPELRGLAFYITTSCQKLRTSAAHSPGGRRRIRTSVGVCQLIYSQPRLATSVSAQYVLIFRIAAIAISGADDGTRTHDLSLTKRLLYRLSYVGPKASVFTLQAKALYQMEISEARCAYRCHRQSKSLSALQAIVNTSSQFLAPR